jgi:hypothetical protein
MGLIHGLSEVEDSLRKDNVMGLGWTLCRQELTQCRKQVAREPKTLHVAATVIQALPNVSPASDSCIFSCKVR